MQMTHTSTRPLPNLLVSQRQATSHQGFRCAGGNKRVSIISYASRVQGWFRGEQRLADTGIQNKATSALTAEGRYGAASRQSADRFAEGRAGDPPRRGTFNPNEQDSPFPAKRKPVRCHPIQRIRKPRCNHRRIASAPAPRGWLALRSPCRFCQPERRQTRPALRLWDSAWTSRCDRQRRSPPPCAPVPKTRPQVSGRRQLFWPPRWISRNAGHGTATTAAPGETAGRADRSSAPDLTPGWLRPYAGRRASNEHNRHAPAANLD